MKILYIVPTDPRETGYGGQQRTHVVWKGLRAIPGSEVTAVVPVPHTKLEKSSEADGVFHVCADRRNTPGWLFERLMRRLVPYCDWSCGYRWREFHKRFADADVVFVRYIRFMDALKLYGMGKPVYLDADDIHTAEFDLQTKFTGNGILRRFRRWIIGWRQFAMYAKARRVFVPAFEHVLMFPKYPLAMLPNIPCPPLPDVSGVRGDGNRLMFVGLLASDPNILALDGFLRGDWAKLKAEFPDLELDVIGAGLPEAYAEEWKKYEGVNLPGRVGDLRPRYERAMALVTPMVIGMGTCIKVLEALGMGRPVVSTERGLRGIPMEDRTHANGIFQYGSTAELAEAIRELRGQTEAERMAMARNAMAFVDRENSQRVLDGVLLREVMQ